MGGPYNLQTFFGVYNFIVNTSKRVLFLPPSDAYVRSFLYLLYTWMKLYYTKALSDQASSLAPDWILLLGGPRIPVYSRDSTTAFHDPMDYSLSGSSARGIFQARVLEWGAIAFSLPLGGMKSFIVYFKSYELDVFLSLYM